MVCRITTVTSSTSVPGYSHTSQTLGLDKFLAFASAQGRAQDESREARTLPLAYFPVKNRVLVSATRECHVQWCTTDTVSIEHWLLSHSLC